MLPLQPRPNDSGDALSLITNNRSSRRSDSNRSGSLYRGVGESSGSSSGGGSSAGEATMTCCSCLGEFQLSQMSSVSV